MQKSILVCKNCGVVLGSKGNTARKYKNFYYCEKCYNAASLLERELKCAQDMK